MKKVLSVILSLVMLLSVTAGLSFNASALDSSGSCGTNATYTFDSDTGILIISGTGNMRGYDGADISPFANDENIKKIIIESGITAIGYADFSGCTGLTNILIPDTVKLINDFAFIGSTNLQNVYYAGAAADWNTETGLKINTGNDPVKNATVYSDCWYGTCGNNAYYIFYGTDMLRIFGKGAMDDCPNEDTQPYTINRDKVVYIVIEDGITTIGKYAFSKCSNAKSVRIPSTVVAIGDYAFDGCTSLNNVYYNGTPMQFKDIAIGEGNEDMTDNAAITSGGETLFKITYDFNGGTKDGAGSYVSYQVGYAPNISEYNFINTLGVTPPNGKTLDAIEINGVRYELGSGYMLNCNTTYKYLWKDHAHKCVTKIVKATTKTNGSITEKCSLCGKVLSKKKISAPQDYILKKEDYTYDGKAKKPKVIIKDLKGKKIAASNYKVTYEKGRKKIGAYKVTVTFKGKYYKGKKTLKFRINPKGTTVTKLVSNKKKSFKVSWKQCKKDCSGYEIIYSTNPKFGTYYYPYPVSKGNKNTTMEIKNLDETGTFYVKVRTYKIVKGKKYYSNWSKAKSVVVK